MRVPEWLAQPEVDLATNTTASGKAIRVMLGTMSRDGLYLDLPRKRETNNGDDSEEQAFVRVAALDAALEWELQFIAEMEELAELAPSNLLLTYWSVRSRDDGIDEAQSADFGLVGVSFGLIIVFVSLVNSSKNPIETRTWVALAGVLCAALSIPAGFGIAAAAGVEMASTVGLAPFLLIGVGVDDMFIFSSAVQRTPQEWSVERRMGRSTKDAALAVTVTTITNVVAFGIGATSPFRAVISFCIYTICSILAVYFLMCTILVACIALDLRREADGRSALTCRRRRTPEDDAEIEEPGPIKEPLPARAVTEPQRPAARRPSRLSVESTALVPIPPSTPPLAGDAGDASTNDGGTPLGKGRNFSILSLASERSQGDVDSKPSPIRMPASPRHDHATALGLQRIAHFSPPPSPQSSRGGGGASGGAKKRRRRSSALPRREELQVHGYVGAKLDRVFARKLGPCIVFPPTMVAVVVVYTALIAISLYGLSNLKQGLELTKMSPDGHHSNEFEVVFRSLFEDAGRLHEIVVDGALDYRLANVRNAVNAVPAGAVGRTPYLLSRERTWLDAFDAFLEDQHPSKAFGDLSASEFRSVFADWLSTESGTAFGPALSLYDVDRQQQLPRFNQSEAVDRLQNGAQVSIRACLLPVIAKSSSKSQEDAATMEASRDAVKDSRAAAQRRFGVDLPSMFPWNELFVIYMQFIVIAPSTALSLAFAALAIMIVALVLLPSPIMIATMLLGIVGIDLLIVGGMWILDIPLDAISSVTMVISIGFSIDFVAHIGHAFLHANGEGFQTNNKCTLPALPSPDEAEEDGDCFGRLSGAAMHSRRSLESVADSRGASSSSSSSSSASVSASQQSPMAAQWRSFLQQDPEVQQASNLSSSPAATVPRAMDPAPVESQGVDKMCFGPSRQARVVEGLTLLGRPVFQGGLSTLLGIIPLAFTESYIFNVFFAMLFMTILFGLVHGILVIPMYLRTWGPPRLHAPERTPEKDIIKMKQPRRKKKRLSFWRRAEEGDTTTSGPGPVLQVGRDPTFQSVTNPMRSEPRAMEAAAAMAAARSSSSPPAAVQGSASTTPSSSPGSRRQSVPTAAGWLGAESDRARAHRQSVPKAAPTQKNSGK